MPNSDLEGRAPSMQRAPSLQEGESNAAQVRRQAGILQLGICEHTTVSLRNSHFNLRDLPMLASIT